MNYITCESLSTAQKAFPVLKALVSMKRALDCVVNRATAPAFVVLALLYLALYCCRLAKGRVREMGLDEGTEPSKTAVKVAKTAVRSFPCTGERATDLAMIPPVPDEDADFATIPLGAGQKIEPLNTVGDGSCWLHALIGEEDASGQLRCEGQEARRELCQWIRDEKNKGTLPSRIRNILEDNLRHPGEILPAFNARKDLRQDYTQREQENASEWRQPLNAVRDDVIEEWVNDETVLEEYLGGLENSTREGLQEELILAAECFKKRLILVQPDWDQQAGHRQLDPSEVKVSSASVYNLSSTDAVTVWYNGHNHYERASISSS